MTTRRKRMSHAQWRGHIEAQKKSDLTVEAYCLSHDLGMASFHQHRSRMRKEQEHSPTSGGFVELRPASSGLKLLDPSGGWVLELEAGFDPATLQRFLVAIRP
jgi:hypothetical protein